jgi:hypothetical protein
LEAVMIGIENIQALILSPNPESALVILMKSGDNCYCSNYADPQGCEHRVQSVILLAMTVI